MITGNNYAVNITMKNCLVELDFIFQWLAMTENKKLKTEYAEMGSNFAKYKIIPEYITFIQPACEAEKNFSEGNYHGCGNSCRFSLEAFTDYIYRKENLTIDSDFFFIDRITGDRVSDVENPTGYKLTTGWLNAKISSSSFQNFFKTKNAFPSKREKQLAAQFSHYNENTDYNAKDALSILSMIYNLYSHCVENRYLGTPHFDVSLLENAPRELIEPQLYIDENGQRVNVIQNDLIKTVYTKKLTEQYLKSHLALINKPDVLGNTPLSLAVYNDDYDTVKLLLDNGADPNFYFKNDMKDFYKSVGDEISKDEARYSGVWSDYIEAHRCIPLIIAIKKDNPDIVRLLLKYSAKTWDSWIDDFFNIAKIPTECSTLLTCAIFYNANACVNMLLDEDILDNSGKKIEILIDPEFQDSRYTAGGRKIYGTIEGVTALMLAAENGNFDVVDQLLDKGARLDVIDKYRNSVFLHAVQNKRKNNVLRKLLREGEKSLDKEKLAELINHAGLAGCPLNYVNVNDANLLLKYGADVNAKNEWGVSCIVDTALISPELIPWMKEHGAELNFKELFLRNSYLEIKDEDTRMYNEYTAKAFCSILSECSALLTPDILNFTVPINNIPQITPLVDSIIFLKAKEIQITMEYTNKFATDLSQKQKRALFENYPFIKKLEMAGINSSTQEEVESKFNTDKIILESIGKTINWEMNLADIKNAIDGIKSSIPYENFKISPLDDALLAKNYDAAAIYLSKGIQVSQFTKLLLVSVNNPSAKHLISWNEVLSELKTRNDIDFTDVLLLLCKNHPKDDFDIAEEFINNGYNFYRFANHILPAFVAKSYESPCPDYDYNNQKLYFQNNDGTYNMSPSIEDIRIRNNNEFLRYFDETSFQDVNLRLIKKAISFGANPNIQDETKKSALDYARINGIDESIFIVEQKYDFSVDMRPSKKGAILGHVEINGEKVKGSIAKQLIPKGKVASDYSNQKLKVILKSELQTKQAGDPYYKLAFAP